MQALRTIIYYFRSLNRAWLITWGVIFISFMLLDAFLDHSPLVTAIKVLGIILNLFYGFAKAPKDHLLQLALLFTLLADTILVLDSTSMDGVFVFCLAQFFHITRFAGTRPRSLILYFLVVLTTLVFATTQNIPPMYALGFIYALSLGANIVYSRRWWKSSQRPVAACALVGFILFALCDTCVAISYLSFTAVLPAFLYPLANYFAWFFYYPSQVLVANSSALENS